jgi:SAM-dependent methyltransferase
VTVARYDSVAEFYVASWPDACDDPATAALLDQVGAVSDVDVLDVACGHGRVSRELARRGGRVVGVDVSRELLRAAQEADRADPPTVRYEWADLNAGVVAGLGGFALAVCNFGLSDIDDLDHGLAAVSAALRPGGRFVLSILHPCFPGAGPVSGSWPADQPYSREGHWTADGAESSLRRRVGANHRMLSTYLNALSAHGFRLDRAVEPDPPTEWANGSRAEAARLPTFLVLAVTRL